MKSTNMLTQHPYKDSCPQANANIKQ